MKYVNAYKSQIHSDKIETIVGEANHNKICGALRNVQQRQGKLSNRTVNPIDQIFTEIWNFAEYKIESYSFSKALGNNQ